MPSQRKCLVVEFESDFAVAGEEAAEAQTAASCVAQYPRALGTVSRVSMFEVDAHMPCSGHLEVRRTHDCSSDDWSIRCEMRGQSACDDETTYGVLADRKMWAAHGVLHEAAYEPVTCERVSWIGAH